MPPVSAFDEKLKAEVLKIKADAARVLGVDMGLDMRYVLSDVLGLSEERANELMNEAHLSSMDTATAADVGAMIKHLEEVTDGMLLNTSQGGMLDGASSSQLEDDYDKGFRLFND